MNEEGIKFLPTAKVIELLQSLPPDSFVHPNRVGNLLVYGADMNELGFVDFNLDGEFESFAGN